VPGKIETIRIEGYLSILDASVELRDLNLLIGANGSGKSNFVSALELLGRIVDSDLSLYVGRRGGASALLYRGPGSGDTLLLDIDFAPNGYRAGLVAAAGDRLIFQEEEIRFQDATRDDVPWVGSLGRGHQETLLHHTVDERGRNSVAAHVLDVLRGCRVFHFHDTTLDAPVKRFADVGDNRNLAADAANLAPFLRRILDEHPSDYERIRSTVAQVAPFFRDFVLEEERNRMRLRWRQVGVDGDFGVDALSDGTLRFICLTTLLLQPDPPPLIVLDEPELGLHPYAVVVLAGMLRSAASRCQVVAATQSVSLIDQFDVEDLIVVERSEGESTFGRRSSEDFERWLADYSVGELWEKNLLGGRPIREAG
jgi:predicted ATPase